MEAEMEMEMMEGLAGGWQPQPFDGRWGAVEFQAAMNRQVTCV